MNKTVIIKSRISEKQFLELNRMMSLKKYSSFNMSKLIRFALDEFKKNNRFEATEEYIMLFRVLCDLTLDMSRVTGNLNQIAYRLNINEDPGLNEIVKVVNEYAALNRVLHENFKSLKNEVQKMSNGIYYDNFT